MLQVAPDLLGRVVVHDSPEGTVAVRLTEVEAYAGPRDPGSHAYRGRTPRNGVMFGPGGFVYVYFSYGMHWCMNLVCGAAGEPVRGAAARWRGRRRGIELAQRGVRRPGVPRDLARGPARLTSALGIDKAYDGADATAPRSALRVLRRRRAASGAPAGAPRATRRASPATAASGPGGSGSTASRGVRLPPGGIASRPDTDQALLCVPDTHIG